jgi:ABC-type glycerol-3-phosphate transport system permease component
MDANPHCPSNDLVLIMIVPVIAMALALERYIARSLLVGAVKR